MKHTKKRVAALLLALAMVLSLMPMAFAADEFPDMPAEDDPSYAAVKSAVDNEIMTGENGALNLEGTILRSTVSKMVVTAFAAKGEADLSGYSDVNSDAWYAAWMAKANQMGIMTGTSGMMRPGDEVTLLEVAAMLVRALGLEPGSAADLEGIPGAEDVNSWAIPYVAALVKAGYISDVTGANQPMTRGAFAEVIYKVSGEGNYVSEGEITEDVNGNIIITSDGVSLKGITVTGDVIIADGVDAGSISLDGVTIEGRLVVRGGSSVELTNSTASATVISKTFDEVTLKADDASDTGAIAVSGTNRKAADKVILDMAEPNATISTDTSVAIQNATGGTVSMEAANVSVTVESGTLDNISVADGMESAKIEVAEGATIGNITTNTDITVTGEGTVSEVTGSGVVSDESGEVIGGGDDEPAEVPDISDAPFTSEGDTTTPSGAVSHTHNYDRENAKAYDATNHVFICVDKAEEKDGDTVIAPAIDGCGAMIYEPHTFDAQGVCTVCEQKKAGSVATEGEVEAGEGEGDYNCDNHSWKLKSTTASTCEDAGNRVWECTNTDSETGKKCASTKTDTLETLAHTPVKDSAKSTDATCDTDGATKYKCSVCDAALDDLTVTVSKETVAHNVVRDAESDVAATCQTPGKEGWKCSVCEADLSKDLGTSPNAHDWADVEYTDNDDGTHSRTCGEENCSYTETRAHTWGVDDAAVAATCVKKGSTASYACSDCNATKEATEIAATGKHNAASAWSSDASKHWHACGNDSDCTEKFAEADHSWSALTDGNKADGAYCTVCGYGKSAGGSGSGSGSGSGGGTETPPPTPTPTPTPDPEETEETEEP